MANEIDKGIFDSLMHAHIDFSRYSDQQIRDIVSLFNSAADDITARISTVDNWTNARLKAVLKEINATANDAYQSASDQLREEMVAFAPHAGEVMTAAMATSLPVSWSPVALTKDQLLSIIDKTPIRIGTNQALLYDEIFQGLADGMEEKVRGALRLGMVNGEGTPELVRRIKGTRANQYKDGILEGSRRDIANIVHTTVMHTSNQAAALTFQNNSDVLNGWVDVATLDGKTCMFCVSMSGRVFALDESGPPWHIGCRCFRAPAPKSWQQLGFKDMPEYPTGMRASAGGPVKADISFNDWLKGQPKAVQVELLGPTRADLFRNGGLSLDRFTDSSGKLLTLEQLKAR